MQALAAGNRYNQSRSDFLPADTDSTQFLTPFITTVQLFSQVSPPYLPEPGQTSVLRLGIDTLPIAEWLQIDADFTAFHQHKGQALQERRDQVCLSLPDSELAQEQFGLFLLAHLQRYHGRVYSVQDRQLHHITSGLHWSTSELALEHSSRWIQEDICLLEPRNDHYILAAASVCAPSNWKLEDKIGRTLDTIHAPVPGYAEALADRVNRLLAGIKAGKPLYRYNWSLQDGNELLWRPDGKKATSGAPLYWRVERQSLLRIPDTRIIIFSIRIFLHSLESMSRIEGFRGTLREILARLPVEQSTYKGLLNKTIV